MRPTDVDGPDRPAPVTTGPAPAPEQLALAAFSVMEDKKAHALLLLDVSKITPLADYFLIGTGNNPIHCRAIVDAVLEELAKAGRQPSHVEGYELGHWILVDYGFLIVHVFTREEREFYSLERLWGQAPVVRRGEE